MLEITAKPELKNSLFGLCGNFDGDARNDFNSSTGSVMLDADKFAQSWKIPGDGFCSIQSPSVRASVFMPRSNCCKAFGYKIFRGAQSSPAANNQFQFNLLLTMNAKSSKVHPSKIVFLWYPHNSSTGKKKCRNPICQGSKPKGRKEARSFTKVEWHLIGTAFDPRHLLQARINKSH